MYISNLFYYCLIMPFSPILLSEYSKDSQIAWMQRTGELVTVKIIDPEIERIKNMLLYDVFVVPGDDESLINHIKSILTKEHEMPTIQKFDRFVTKVPILLEDPDIDYAEKKKIAKELNNKKTMLFWLESDTDLTIERLHYCYNLEAIKESIIYVIQQPACLRYLRKKHKHSAEVRIYLYKEFIKKEHTVNYEAFDSIYDQIDSICAEISSFKKNYKQK